MNSKKLPIIFIIFIVLTTSAILYFQGRLLICACGTVFLWVGDIWSSNNSQHLFDPYSFTHLLHGFLFCWLLLLPKKDISYNWKLVVVVMIESIWEVVENSSFIINRYRENTLALGYQGDTIINSLSDILMCAIGFSVAKYLGLKKSLIIFVITEIILLLWIRDNLTLNIIMLLYPLESIKTWQMGNQ